MEIKVLFFGILADITGTRCKHYRDVKSLSDLKFKIYDDFPEVVHYNFRIFINSMINIYNTSLNNNDEVALIPPFAGG
jgi:sulfur-carrier protein